MSKRNYFLVLLIGLMVLVGLTFKLTRAADSSEAWFQNGMIRLSPLNPQEGEPNLLYALCELKPDDSLCQTNIGWEWGYDAVKALENMGLTETIAEVVWAKTPLFNPLDSVQWLEKSVKCGRIYDPSCEPLPSRPKGASQTKHILELVQYVPGNPAQLTYQLHLAHGPEYCQWTAHLVGGSIVILDGTYSNGSFIGVTYPEDELPYPFEIWCEEGHDTNYYR
jgi:hypothetical protein